MTTPWLAMPAVTMAICSGEAVTEPWPKPDSAVCGGSSPAGYCETAWFGRSSRYSWLKPKACACWNMSFAPTLTAIGAKLVLQEYSMAWVNGIFGLSHPPTTSLCTTLFDCGSRYTGPAGTSELEVYGPCWIAALAVTTLNVEPGGSVVCTARFSRGWVCVFDSWAAYAFAFWKSWSASLFGS